MNVRSSFGWYCSIKGLHIKASNPPKWAHITIQQDMIWIEILIRNLVINLTYVKVIRSTTKHDITNLELVSSSQNYSSKFPLTVCKRHFIQGHICRWLNFHLSIQCYIFFQFNKDKMIFSIHSIFYDCLLIKHLNCFI